MAGGTARCRAEVCSRTALVLARFAVPVATNPAQRSLRCAEMGSSTGPALPTPQSFHLRAERVSLQESEQDETKFFRAASALAQRDTARPPADPIPQRPDHITHSNKYRIPPRSEPPEDPTAIFRRADLEQQENTFPELALEAPLAKNKAPSSVARAVQPQAGLAPAPLASVASSSKPRHVAFRQLTIVLLLLAALVAFAGTSTRSFALHEGEQASLGHSGLRWLQNQTGKVARWFHSP